MPLFKITYEVTTLCTAEFKAVNEQEARAMVEEGRLPLSDIKTTGRNTETNILKVEG